jgi:hypothetical protein
MPLVFIHGVNIRDGDPGYFQALSARCTLLRRLWLEPLRAKGPRYSKLAIANPYWGRYGVRFHWNHETIPKVEGPLDYLGGERTEIAPEADYEMAAILGEAGAQERDRGAKLETMGGSGGVIKRAAQRDLGRFLEAVLAPVATAEMSLAVDDVATSEQVGVRTALLMEAADALACAAEMPQRLAEAVSDDDVIEVCQAAVLEQFERRARAEPTAGQVGPKPDSSQNRLETLGALEGGWAGLRDRTVEFFDRARDAPRRVLSTAAIDRYRAAAHSRLARFFGDVFVYLQHRGDRDRPGPIVSTILIALLTSPRSHPDEPLIVLTHSMGGNIFYDILTYFAPDLQVDAWISVGGQVGQFEEMKLFKASDGALGKPAKVRGLKPRVKYWLNVYDPVDLFGFLAGPVFEDVDEDLRFQTGAGDAQSHGAYFLRPRFFREVRSRLEEALQ